MSTEANKAKVRRIIDEAWNKGNLVVIDELLSPEYVLHIPSVETKSDLEGYKQAVSMHRASFDNYSITIDDMVAEGDKVVIRWTIRGTHTGDYMGIAPTGKEVTYTGISIRRFEGDKIVEEWLELDMLGLMQQMGVVPPPAQAGK